MMVVACGVCCGVWVGPKRSIVKMMILRFKQLMLVPFGAFFSRCTKMYILAKRTFLYILKNVSMIFTYSYVGSVHLGKIYIFFILEKWFW
jgi:hypothetical protein